MNPFRSIFLTSAALLASAASLHAQWVSEDYDLKAGWNAIWLSHDASHDTLDNLLPASVEEVWRWNPHASTTQFTQAPPANEENPIQPDTQWLRWRRGFPIDTTMTALAPNAAYLVKVADGTADFTHSLTGKPVPPRYSWKSSGLNFFGFPSKTPETNFETFFSHSTALSAGPDIFKYNGGPITSNPVEVLAPLFEDVTRGKAYWIRSSQFTDYYGPLDISIGDSGLAFSDTGTALALKIRNVTEESVTATLAPVTSETAPVSPAVAGNVPLRLRGALNPTTGQFDYTAFSAATPIVLAAGEEKELIFAVDRATMGGTAGDVFQSVLRITDSLGISEIDLPVSAVTTSRSGLWVGTAVVTAVDQVAASNQQKKNLGGQPLYLDENGNETTEETDYPAYEKDVNGSVEIEVTETADASAPSAFPVRLIVHRNDAGAVKLLQQVYLGENTGGNSIVADSETPLDPAKLATARRLSSSTFPLDANILRNSGDLGLSGTAQFSVVLAYDESTNPFVHGFHPDHDNKNEQFASVGEGIESYDITRTIDLAFSNDPASLGLSDLGWGSTVLGGTYSETVVGLRAQLITVTGKFVLRRVSAISTLTE
jgi:hypothetical protein